VILTNLKAPDVPLVSAAEYPRGLTSLRSANRRLVIHELQRHRHISRADLGRATGLSGTTISSLVSELIEAGMVTDSGVGDRATGRSGRPGRMLRLVSERKLVAGIELAHDSLRVAVSDLAGVVLAERSQLLDIDGAGPSALDFTLDRLDEVVADSGIDRSQLVRIVLGIPGFVDPASGTVVSERMPAWKDVVLTDLLTERTGLPADAENDADLAALGERMFGSAQGFDDVVYVKVSSGIGAGLVLGGRLYRATRGGAGEIGHIQVREDGSICSCGNRGCLETVAAVPGAIGELRSVHPDLATSEDLLRLLRAGDPAATRIITDMGRAIGRAIADLCNVLAPQAVVIGGDLEGAAPLVDAVRASVARYTQPRVAHQVHIVPTALGHRAGVLGAVAAAIDAHPLLSA